MNYDMEKLWKDSHTSAGHSSYLEGLYESYLENPASVSIEWKNFFDELPDNNGSHKDISPVSYTHLTLPTKRIV